MERIKNSIEDFLLFTLEKEPWFFFFLAFFMAMPLGLFNYIYRIVMREV